MDLVIVESPTKIKTLRRLLDSGWSFEATRGHMYDLPASRMGLSEDYEAEWVPQSSAPIGRIRKAAGKADQVFIASDPDREGEAIAWQVQELVLNGVDARRLRLESLTSSDVTEQLEHPQRLDWDRVYAQWARRILDRLAGYKVSPFLMNAFKGKKLSAGRVQSAVLARIVQRWKEVEAFEPETFYRLLLDLKPAQDAGERSLTAELARWQGDPVGTGEEQRLLSEREVVEEIEEAVQRSGVDLDRRSREQTETHPARPFDSSSLIGQVGNWFGWPASKTMKLAQILYEKGLITYHRSDSNRISRDGCAAAAAFIREEYGTEYHQWRGGGGGDQEGHEAIRAKNPGLRPGDLNRIDGDLKELYGVIWQRYVQSQMIPARWDQLKCMVVPGESCPAEFEASIRSILEWGFYRCRRSGVTPPPEREWSPDEFEAMARAEEFRVEETRITESETSGPSLFTEGSLVSMMKSEGIGRPSTYGSTIVRLKKRQYIRSEKGSLVPTRRGRDVCRFLQRAIPAICDVELTRQMEQSLDEIARGEATWDEFVESFDQKLESWLEEGRGLEPEGTAETEHEPLEFAECPRCGDRLILRQGSKGKFVHCESEDCEFTSDPPAKTYKCPECDRHMVRGRGGNRRVYSCLNHPHCQGKRPVGEPSMTLEEYLQEAPDCPECGGSMVERKGRYGLFWGCSHYPDCDGTRSRK